MTTPVADKNLVPPKIWRRHSDPPSLWIFAAISSVSLHLLVFWWLRSLPEFGLGFSPENSAIVPIDIIELPATTNLPVRSPLFTKQVSPKPKISSPKTSAAKSRQTPLPKTAQTTPKNQISTNITPVKPQPIVKKTVSQPQPLFTTKPKPIPQPVNPLPGRQQIVLGKGKPLPGLPPENSTPEQPPTSPGNSSTTPSTPTPESTPPTPQTPNPAGVTLKIAPLPKDEVLQLGQVGRLRIVDLPDVLPVYQGSNTKKLPASYLNGETGLAPAELLASLVIDENGNFQQAFVIEIQPTALKGKKSMYQQAINELFQSEKFTPGQNQDGSKPPLSNLFVKISFQSASQN